MIIQFFFLSENFNSYDFFPQIGQDELDSVNYLSFSNSTKSQVTSRFNFPFRSQEEKDQNYDVAICAPALFYYNDDVSKQLLEWFTILQALKISKVFIYIINVHPNIMKVLNHYEKIGFISITEFNNPSPVVSTSSFLRYIIMIIYYILLPF